MVKIGNIILRDKPLFLAPMEDVTDVSFRHICKLFGADMVYTEFVSSEAVIRDAAKSLKKLTIIDTERPIGIQLYGHQVDSMVRATHIAARAAPDLIDINCGCPVKKIATRGAGAGLLKNTPLMLEMTEAIVKATTIPVTVKTRLGWDDNSKNIVELAEQLQDKGIQALTVHARTRSQLYKGTADWSLLAEIKNNQRMHIPIIGNGDITTAEQAAEAFARYGVDGIMIGRGAIGRPWLFRQVRHYLDTGVLLPEPSIAEKVELAKKQLRYSIEYKGFPRGIYEMRRHLCNYFKGLPHFKQYRLQLVTSLNVDEIIELLEKIGQTYNDFF